MTFSPPLDDATLQESVNALFAAGGKITVAAKALGINPSTLQNRLVRASERGVWGPIKESPAIPYGQVVKGLSTLYGPDGEAKAQWVKTTREGEDRGLLEAAIKEAFTEFTGAAPLIPEPKTVDEDLLTTYLISDQHLGLYAWHGETGGESYDLDIGSKLLREAMRMLVTRAPKAETAVVLSLGDFFHSDSDENRTRRSGNALDVDTRYAKILKLGVQLIIDCVGYALQKHKRVIVRCIPGNHDPYASLALSVALSAFYHADPRVEVDMDASPFWHFTFGDVMLVAAHGDEVKPDQISGIAASYWPEEWGKTKYRFAYFGHVHHKALGGEANGMIWESFQTLAAKDAWHYRMGYKSNRSMTAITHHRERGEYFRHTVGV